MKEISARYVANLYEYGAHLGMDENRLRQYLTNVRLDVCLPDSKIDPFEFENTFRDLYKNSNDKYFGLHFGSFLNLKALGLVYQLSLEATDLSECLFLIKEYFIHTFPIIQIQTNELENAFEIKIECSISDYELKAQLSDTILCFLYREISHMVTTAYLPQVIAPQDYVDEFSLFLKTEVKHGKEYLIRFNKSLYDIPLNKKSLKEIEFLLPHFLKMLNKKKPNYGPFSLQMRNMILNMCNPALPTFDQVAKQFPISNRSIQRKLTAEGLSFRRIADDIKMELYSCLITRRSIKTQDIAFILGYSESSAYLHAVKRWEKLVR